MSAELIKQLRSARCVECPPMISYIFARCSRNVTSAAVIIIKCRKRVQRTCEAFAAVFPPKARRFLTEQLRYTNCINSLNLNTFQSYHDCNMIQLPISLYHHKDLVITKKSRRLTLFSFASRILTVTNRDIA